MVLVQARDEPQLMRPDTSRTIYYSPWQSVLFIIIVLLDLFGDWYGHHIALLNQPTPYPLLLLEVTPQPACEPIFIPLIYRPRRGYPGECDVFGYW